MQFSSVTVALAGDPNNVVVKSTVPVPEVLVLMACHGLHAVNLLPNTLSEARGESPVVEMARLARVYGEKPVEDCLGKATFNTRLPTRFAEIGLAEEFQEREVEALTETPAERKRREAVEQALADIKGTASDASADSAAGAFGTTDAGGDKSGDTRTEGDKSGK